MLILAAAMTAAPQISYVASVKPNVSAEARSFSEYFPGARFTATAITVRNLLRIAYRLQDYQLVGAPAWFSTKRYDITAKADDNPPPSPPPSQQSLLRALLADRFNFSAHNETRELPGFALVVSRSDRWLGPQLIQSDFDCAAYAASAHALPDPTRTPACATRGSMGALSAKAITMTQLARALTPFVGRFTTDRTDLTGRFDVDLSWTPGQEPEGLSIFTAIQEQLGLKLVAGKAPVDVLVVDRAAEPTGN